MKEDHKQKKSGWLRMLLITAYLVLGILFLALPDMIVSILPVILGGLLVVETVLKVCRILTLWKNGYQNWWMPMAGCLILAVLGILLAADIFEQTYTLIRIFGGGLLADGILEFWLQAAHRKLKRPGKDSTHRRATGADPYDAEDDYIEVYDDPDNDADA